MVSAPGSTSSAVWEISAVGHVTLGHPLRSHLAARAGGGLAALGVRPLRRDLAWPLWSPAGGSFLRPANSGLWASSVPGGHVPSDPLLGWSYLSGHHL